MKLLGICDSGFSESLMSLMNAHDHADFHVKSKRHGTDLLKIIDHVFHDCNLVLAGANLDSISDVCNALDWLTNFNLSALNISWALKERNDEIIYRLRQIQKKGTSIFCAKNERLPYPWSEFIGIGKEEQSDEIDWLDIRGSSVSCAIHSALFMKRICEGKDKIMINHFTNLDQLNLQI